MRRDAPRLPRDVESGRASSGVRIRRALAAVVVCGFAWPVWAQAPAVQPAPLPGAPRPAPVPDTLVPPPSETKTELEDETRKLCIATLLAKHPDTSKEEIAGACGK